MPDLAKRENCYPLSLKLRRDKPVRLPACAEASAGKRRLSVRQLADSRAFALADPLYADRVSPKALAVAQGSSEARVASATQAGGSPS